MDLHLGGKVAVITGTSKGIGLAIARSLLVEGASVVCAARSGSPELTALVEDSRAHSVLVDLTAPGAPEQLVAEAISVFGRIDVLVNNVGAVKPRLQGFLEISEDDWDVSLTINFRAAVRTTRAVLPHLLEQESSTIVTISSVNAFLPDPPVIDYSAAKAALTNFCKSLSKEFGPRGVRVNTVSPGPVETALWLGDDGVAAAVARSTGRSAEAVAKQAVAGTPTGRFTLPQEVADLVLLLASDRAGNVTGADFVIDGGLISTT